MECRGCRDDSSLPWHASPVEWWVVLLQKLVARSAVVHQHPTNPVLPGFRRCWTRWWRQVLQANSAAALPLASHQKHLHIHNHCSITITAYITKAQVKVTRQKNGDAVHFVNFLANKYVITCHVTAVLTHLDADFTWTTPAQCWCCSVSSKFNFF